MTTLKVMAAMVPFVMFSTSPGQITPGEVSDVAGGILKYGELGLCLVLVAYLMYSNFSLIQSMREMIQTKTAQEERLINALNSFCVVCRERPCLAESKVFDDDNPANIAKRKEE